MNKELKNSCNPIIFEEVFNLYAKDLKRFLFFKYRDLETAEDVMQDSFVKLWENCENVPYDKVKSYLFTIANNQFLNIKKHEKVIRKNEFRHTKSITNESPEFLMIEQEYLVEIEDAIASLTHKQREVFLLSRIEKKKYKEIALQLNISVKAVEKRMHLALIVMRKVMKVG
ncbi:MAG: sigma-70 family RNA polymerase sigma factor [Flavobacteriaceae bacterium]